MEIFNLGNIIDSLWGQLEQCHQPPWLSLPSVTLQPILMHKNFSTFALLDSRLSIFIEPFLFDLSVGQYIFLLKVVTPILSEPMAHGLGLPLSQPQRPWQPRLQLGLPSTDATESTLTSRRGPVMCPTPASIWSSSSRSLGSLCQIFTLVSRSLAIHR